ncbi:MAG: 30S ribosomal protein S1 [Treponemataceae bacterium]
MNHLQSGQELELQIVAITDDTIFLDLNSKTEGILEKAELVDKDGNFTLKEGDKIKTYFVGNKNGEMIFTTKISGEKADKSMLENAWKNNIPVEGKVEKEIKGGFEIKIGQTRAFCPFSQMGFKQKEEPSFYIGKILKFIITEYKREGKDILVSNKMINQIEHENNITNLAERIKEGNIVEATVVSLQKFGAFVEIENFKALLPISEVSLNRIESVENVLSIGQKITVKIIKADWKNEKVCVSLKALQENPWKNSAEKFSVGKKFNGKITRISEFGLFVNIADGIDGLVHISELDQDRSTNLRKKFNVGDNFSVVVKEINENQQRLSLKPATSSEQDKITAKYMKAQDSSDGENYNPFAALLSKK